MYEDAFFNDKDQIMWIYYNPDSIAGGQYVVNYITHGDIKEAMSEKTPNDFFEKLSCYATQYLYDMGTDSFDIINQKFHQTPNYMDCTDKTMVQLIQKAGGKENE